MDARVFRAFTEHAAGRADVPNDYFATKTAMMRMFPKLAMGLDSHAALAQSLYHNNGANAVGQLARANPAHRGGLLGAVKQLAPAVGGVRAAGTNPLRAAASGLIHAKLAGALGHAIELGGLGILARPSIQKLRGKQVSHASEAKHELLGLGTLAAPSAYHLLAHR